MAPDSKNIIASTVARRDAVIASLFALSVPLVLWYSDYLARDAVARYARNVDSGSLTGLLAIYFLLPASALFAFASLSAFRLWRFQVAAHRLAILWLTAPFVLLLVAELRLYRLF